MKIRGGLRRSLGVRVRVIERIIASNNGGWGDGRVVCGHGGYLWF